MKLKQLTVENVAGHDFAWDLTPVNVIVGENGSGKTSALNAIKIGLRGYLPRLGKQHNATIKLAAESRLEMAIHLGLHDGTENEEQPFVSRKWRRKGDKGIAYDQKIKGLPEIPSEALDMVEFFKMTGPDQTRFLSSKVNLDPSILSDDTVLAELEKIEVLPMAYCKAAVDELVKMTKNTMIQRKTTRQTLQEWLIDLTARLKDAKKGADDEHKRLAATQVSLRQDGATPKSVEAELKAKEAEYQKLHDLYTQLTTRLTHFNDQAATREKLEAITQKEMPDAGAFHKQLEDRGAIESEMATLRNAREKLIQSKKDLEDRLGEITAGINRLQSEEHCPNCTDRRIDELKAREGKVLEQLNTVKSGIKEVDAKGLGLKSKLEKLPAATELRQKIREVEAALKEYNDAILKLETLTEAVQRPTDEEISDAHKKATKLNQEVEALRVQQSAYVDFMASKDQRDKREQDSTALYVKSEVLKKAIAFITSEQQRIVSAAISQLLEPARKLTDGLIGRGGDGKLDFRGGEIGMETDAGWVSYETFSGRDQAIGFAGFSLALSQQSPIKVVLVDEMGWLDRNVKPAFIKRIIALVEDGTIDFFAGADVDSSQYQEVKHPHFQLLNIG